MNSSRTPPLGNFEQRLLGELRQFVELRSSARGATEGRPLSAATGRPSRSDRLAGLFTARRSVAAGFGVVVVACLAMIGFSAGSSPNLAQAFPVFAKPPTDVRSLLSGILRDQGSAAARVDGSHARAITTPLGIGYVAADPRTNVICLATPGFDHSGWGADCSKVSVAKRDGLPGIESFDQSGRSVAWTEVLPAGVTATASDMSGKTTRLPLHNGVLAVVVHHLTFITTRIAGRASTTRLATLSECNPVTQRGPDCRLHQSLVRR